MRYIYSVVRFVPNPTRGECVNLGLLLGSDETGEWLLETVGRRNRARMLDNLGVLPGVVGELERLAGILDKITESTDYLIPPPGEMEISEEWLKKLADESGNLIQYSRPQPVLAESLTDAVGQLWPLFIVEHEPMERPFITKHGIVSRLKKSLFEHRVGTDNVLQRATLGTRRSHTAIDFAVHNGRVVHMTQCWSFQVQNKEQLLTDVKAWAWTIRDVRLHGGEITGNGKVWEVQPNVPVAVVYAPPVEGDQDGIDEAFQAFRDRDVAAKFVDISQADEIAAAAAEKLSVETRG